MVVGWRRLFETDRQAHVLPFPSWRGRFHGNQRHQQGHPEQIGRRRLFLGLGRRLLFFVLCFFLPAGSWRWTRGWLFILVIVVASILVHTGHDDQSK